MFGLEHMMDTYLVGFALVWFGVLATSAVVAGVGRFRNDWDHAFRKELLGSLSAPVERSLPATMPGRQQGG